jgi:hypothetical protein
MASSAHFHHEKNGRVLEVESGAQQTFKSGSTLAVATGASLTVAGVTVDATTLAANAQTGANVAVVADAPVIGGLIVVFPVLATALTGDVDIVSTHKVRVFSVEAIQVGGAGGAGDTITVKNSATAITNALDLNVADKVVVRATTYDDAAWDIAAGGTLRVSGASGVSAQVNILAYRVA